MSDRPDDWDEQERGDVDTLKFERAQAEKRGLAQRLAIKVRCPFCSVDDFAYLQLSDHLQYFRCRRVLHGE